MLRRLADDAAGPICRWLLSREGVKAAVVVTELLAVGRLMSTHLVQLRSVCDLVLRQTNEDPRATSVDSGDEPRRDHYLGARIDDDGARLHFVCCIAHCADVAVGCLYLEADDVVSDDVGSVSDRRVGPETRLRHHIYLLC